MDNKPVKKQKPAGLPAVIYYNVFQGHKDGQSILDDLAAKFYDRTSITTPVDANATMVMEGQRQVILFILQKCAEGQR